MEKSKQIEVLRLCEEQLREVRQELERIERKYTPSQYVRVRMQVVMEVCETPEGTEGPNPDDPITETLSTIDRLGIAMNKSEMMESLAEFLATSACETLLEIAIGQKYEYIPDDCAAGAEIVKYATEYIPIGC